MNIQNIKNSSAYNNFQVFWNRTVLNFILTPRIWYFKVQIRFDAFQFLSVLLVFVELLLVADGARGSSPGDRAGPPLPVRPGA